MVGEVRLGKDGFVLGGVGRMQNEGRVWHQSGLHKTVLPYGLAVHINIKVGV